MDKIKSKSRQLSKKNIKCSSHTTQTDCDKYGCVWGKTKRCSQKRVSRKPKATTPKATTPKAAPPPFNLITDEQIASILPGVDKKIRDLVKKIMPDIPLDDDFKLRTFASLTEANQYNFLDDQYRLSVIFRKIFKQQLSRILKRDVNDDIDFLFDNGYLKNEQFILANTVAQFRMITFLLTQKHDNIRLYTHESELPRFLKTSDCGACGGKLVYRSGATDDNNQGYIISADEHVFHFSCFQNWLEHSQRCPNCYKQINRTQYDGMSTEEKRLSRMGSNFLSG
jgi:hypothetical protein